MDWTADELDEWAGDDPDDRYDLVMATSERDPADDLWPTDPRIEEYGQPEQEPKCIVCLVTASADPFHANWEEEGYDSPTQYAMDDGTYNAVINRYTCTNCYIAIGMPSSPAGWQVPDHWDDNRFANHPRRKKVQDGN